MLSVYPACVIKEKNGYSVVFPDLDYLATCGDTLDNALAMASECLAGHLYFLEKQGSAAPESSDIQDIHPEDVARELEVSEYEEAFATLVAVNVSEYAKKYFEKAVKKTLSIPAWLNDAAMAHNINFSQVLQEALKKKLHMG